MGLEEAPEPRVVTGAVQAGDTYLLCTDGLMGTVEDEALAEIIAASLGEEPQAIARRLVDAANASGGHDNITAAVVHVDAA